MVKFLNSDGLSRLVTLIKQALSNKQDSRLVVTYVGNNDASSTYGDILNAINAGREVIVKYGYKDYQYCYNDSGWLYFIAVVGGYYYELRVNDEDKWNSDSFQLQSSLVSGTNIKTINNTSLLGSGNISIEPNEIASITTTESTASGGNNVVTITESNGTSHTFNVKNGIDGQDGADGADGVSLGEIALVQTTGDSEESVMSQKGVTEYGRKVTEEDLNGTGDWIRAKLTEEGWEFGKYVAYNGNLTTNANYCVTFFIPVDMSIRKGHSITFGYMFDAWSTANLACYNGSKTFVSGLYYSCNVNNARTATISTSDTWDNAAYIRMTCNPNRLNECYIIDNTTGEYIFKGDEYLTSLTDGNMDFGLFKNNILAQEVGDGMFKTMSQKAISEELQVSRYSNKPTYLQGRLCYFSLADYPDLDLRTADGISVVFTTNSKDVERTPMFDIWNPNNGSNNGMSNKHFGLWQWDANLNFGFLGNYGGITTGGYSFSRVKGHYVITYDFKTGICKCYKNGVLVTTGTPSTWDEQTMVRDYFATCTHIHLCSLDDSLGHKSTGIAIYSNVLTDEDVVSIYGGGKESIKSILTPEIYKANYAHPILTTNWGIRIVNGTATSNTSGGWTINAASSSDYIRFGFTGLEGLINNLIYEWDFEVTSGSSTHNSSINYSRAMRIGGNYYKCFVIYDSNGNDVTFNTLGIGTYHVVSRPNNILAGGINTNYNVYPYVYLEYFFICSSDFSMTILPTLKLTERGAAIECSIRNYRGTHWELPGGIKLPLDDSYIYETSKFILGTDTFVEDTVTYAANNPPQFNGQMAVDSTNGKVYAGYLTGTGGTWKQINNS